MHPLPNLIRSIALVLWFVGVVRAESIPHWAFQPPVSQRVPVVSKPHGIRTPVDAFIGDRLVKEGIKPSGPADRVTLYRRLTLDLTGLPPQPEEVDAFVGDRTEGAYERQVERLLNSPRFGERWARHWLDLARYADSSGYQVDRERPWAWVYRDWVVRSFNRDQGFDRFSLEQLAGDLLYEEERTPRGDPDLLIAGGFHRMALSNHEDGIDAAEFAVRTQVDRVATTGTAWMGLTLGCAECHSHKYDPISQREFYQFFAFFNTAEEADPTVAPGVTAYSFRQRREPLKTFVHVRGDFRRHGEEVRPGFLLGVTSIKQVVASAPTRLDLARWIVSSENPLTARVAVNQIWLHLFGRGLVSTTEDFGIRGEAPSHPELLDWLATEFIRSGWSRKHLIRLIVCSATYKQSSEVRLELKERDPENRLLARQNRIRLEGEVLRDSALAAGGVLNLELGGPAFRAEMPEDVKWLGTAGAWSWKDDTGPMLNRRSLYMYSQRTVPHPLLPVFDQANPNEACTRRERSNTPLQALTLLNNSTFVDSARSLAQLLASQNPANPKGQIREAFRRCLGRNPGRSETIRLEALFKQVQRIDPSQALFMVVQIVMNLDEFQNRD